jgi:hypothetical protein
MDRIENRIEGVIGKNSLNNVTCGGKIAALLG